MNNDKLERFSALIDGELPESEAATLIACMGREASVRETVGRFYLIGDAVRNAVPDQWRPDFVWRVAKAVEQEPFWLLSTQESQAKKKWLVGGAIAASVCVLTLFVSGIDKERVLEPALSPGMHISQETGRTSQAEVQLTQEHPLQTRATSSFASESRLNSYLVKHNQYLDSFTVQGVAPYARVVGYQAGR